MDDNKHGDFLLEAQNLSKEREEKLIEIREAIKTEIRKAASTEGRRYQRTLSSFCSYVLHLDLDKSTVAEFLPYLAYLSNALVVEGFKVTFYPAGSKFDDVGNIWISIEW